jgi:hypothetical protein
MVDFFRFAGPSPRVQLGRPKGREESSDSFPVRPIFGVDSTACKYSVGGIGEEVGRYLADVVKLGNF